MRCCATPPEEQHWNVAWLGCQRLASIAGLVLSRHSRRQRSSKHGTAPSVFWTSTANAIPQLLRTPGKVVQRQLMHLPFFRPQLEQGWEWQWMMEDSVWW